MISSRGESKCAPCFKRGRSSVLSHKQGTDWKQFQKAEELQPNLILLDIGLPNLDELKAAKRILQVAPGAKIICLTSHSDTDLVRAVLTAGAQGYVLKTDAARELFIVVETVLGGDYFVSSGIQV